MRSRPNPRGTRPRSKQRPRHTDATPGTVLAVDRGRYACLVDGATVTAMAARELARGSIVVGDDVRVVGDMHAGPDALARIVAVTPRRSVLRRSADDTDPVERIIVANAEQLAIVTAVADPAPSTGLIDRCLVAAYVGGLTPLLVATKTDLADPGAVRDAYADLDLTVVSTSAELDPGELRSRLAGRVSVLVGHSGVGKSTLVNRLVPDAARAVGRVSGIGKGRHTSSSAVAMPLPGGGWIIDTPGLRSFGLAHVTPADLLVAFADLVPGTQACPRGCDHSGPQVGCALDDFVAAGGASPRRLASYRRLAAALRG